MNRRRAWNVLAALLVLFGYYMFVKETGMGIPCPFRYFFHIECPGCGISRMILALSEGDLKGAFSAHPVLLIWSPFLVYITGKCISAYLYDRAAELRRWERYALYLLLACLIIFFVVRNLPSFAGWAAVF